MFSQILASLEDAQLEGKVETQDEAKRYVLSKFRPKVSEKPEAGPGTADEKQRLPSKTVVGN
jgi:hypothetical protein